jgi:NO-binding membrane sensor protein with MHYT domain
VTHIHHFAYGWINPTIAYLMSFLGSLLGLVLAARSRQTRGSARLRWLVLAGVAIGGTGIWLMHFMAMLGFDVPASVVRYDVSTTVVSLGIAIVVVSVGLLIACLGQPRAWRVISGGTFTGLGVVAMHYTGMAALRAGGQVSYDYRIVGLSVLIAVGASIVAMWFAVAVSGANATVGAAFVMGVAVCGMHYTAMAAVRVRLDGSPVVDAVGPFVLLAPISILACIVIAALAYATVGLSMRQENTREEYFLALVRDQYHPAAVGDRWRHARHR